MTMDNRLQCEDVRGALPLYVGGDLESPEPAAVERHLAGCGACRAEMERARAARAAFAGLEASVGPPPEIWSGVRARLLAEGLLRGAPSAPVHAAPARPAVRRWLPAAVAAAALAVVGAGSWLISGTRLGTSGGEEPRVAEERPTAPVPAELEQRALPEALTPGARPVALHRLAPDEWPTAAPAELELPAGSRGGDGVMAGSGPSTRFH